MQKIGYLGPEGSYSHIAAKKFCADARLCAYRSFPLVMASLVSGETDAVVMPIENTLNGGVLQNLDLLQSTENVCAVAERVIGIDHRLAILRGADKSKIKRIYSHSQALDQCAKYLFEHFPAAELIPARSTAASLEMIKTPEDAGVVGAHVIDDRLVLSKCNIADEDNNYTHFLLIRRGGIENNARSRRIFFSLTCPNKSGALLRLLQKLSDNGINMTKLQSRPVKNAPDEYAFFIEIDGDYSRTEIKSALDSVRSAANSFKLLGCY